ncbi:hypothetical protein B0H19DRAFT_1243211 [Mycena capillaripes]|nr:hypothetical protein B0H19DRAFT_1243211 [Mycena capillaripes]
MYWTVGPLLTPLELCRKIFECWNTVFRLCSVLSNHQVPSLDIAATLADMERFKPQCRLGWASHNLIKPGTVKVLSKAKQQQPASWKTALGSSWNDETTQPINYNTDTNWIGCKYVAARSEDPCYPGLWVFFSDGSTVTAGWIVKILVPKHTLEAAVMIQAFTVSNRQVVQSRMELHAAFVHCAEPRGFLNGPQLFFVINAVQSLCKTVIPPPKLDGLDGQA